MKNILYWIIQDHASLPDDLHWLSTQEQERLNTFRFQKRRQDWLLGRWTVKKLVSLALSIENLELDEIIIQNESSGAPFVLLRNVRLEGSVSISHRGDFAVAAYCHEPALSVGIDLELIEEKTQGFLEDYFTSSEVNQIMKLAQDERFLAASLFWSGREAILKAHQIGLRVDTRSFELRYSAFLDDQNWHPLEMIAYPRELGQIKLFWKQIEAYIITLAVKQKNQEIIFSPDLIDQIS